MKLCTCQPQPLSTPNLHLLARPIPTLLGSLVPNRIQISSSSPRLPRFSHSGFARAAMSEESPSGVGKYSVKQMDGAVAVEVGPSSSETSAYVESESVEVPVEEASSDEQSNDFFPDLNLKMDSLDTYSLLSYGAGALVVLWLASSIAGAIDSIPLFPKLMEVVGLGYSFWFTTRYLLYKQNREELAVIIEDLKQQIFGSDD